MNVMPGLLMVALLNPAQGSGKAAGTPMRISLAAADEPGERLIVVGRVFGPDGKTPIADASLYVYQTDREGIYSKPVNDSRTPRLRANLRTDAEGRYEYSTIKPGSYPDTRNPAHIHYVVSAAGYREKIFEIVFADDPLVNERIRADAAREGSGFSIRALTRDAQGVLRCTQDIRLTK